MRALKQGHYDIAKALVDIGAEVDKADEHV